MKHKVLSLLQPWATLVVMGSKRIETRSWNTYYRGELLIHASQKFDELQAQAIVASGSHKILAAAGHDWRPWGKTTTLPTGMIIGKAELIHVIRSEDSRMAESITHGGHTWMFSEDEKNFGDFSAGRYLWLLANPVMFNQPIPAKGNLNIWNWEGDLPQ